ncbi:hypothetical protein [Enterococcus sp. DIV0660C]|uniref:hypothetical protein n=1 Tax=Enterococcus sp. DIV0660C TaxID=2230880 RepID=UPI001F5CF28C|nr:hypothetical protein [Enterococcus sp. DIV0660C]
MRNFSELLKKYQDAFIYTDKREKTSDILKKLVDVEEKSIDFLSQKRIKLLEENIVNSIYFDESNKTSVKLLFVIHNEKSKKYYQHPYFIQSVTDPLLKDERIYVFYDESVGILETNSSLLALDVRILTGISKKNVEKEDLIFKDYISAFEQKCDLT